MLIHCDVAAPTDAMDKRERSDIKNVMAHRIEVSQEDAAYADTPADTLRFFLEHPIGIKATGGAMPYPILVDLEGGVHQLVPLCRVTPHARGCNVSAVGIGIVGDFRDREPNQQQWGGLVFSVAVLCAQFGLSGEAIVGHDQMSGASHDPDKICPGPGLSLERLRKEVSGLATVPNAAFAWKTLAQS